MVAKKLTPTVMQQLKKIAGKNNVSSQETDLISYSRDAWALTILRMRHGDIPSLPDVVVWPKTPRQISSILKLANKNQIPVVPMGGGAGVCGGTLATHGGILLDLKKINTILNIDEKSSTVTVEAGVLGRSLEDALNAKGYTMGHIPASLDVSTLGGFLAGRSGGVLSSKYGKIEDMVLGLQVVLPTGEIIQTKAVPRSSTGPNLTQLFVGSEGTLGVITKATMRIHPQPEERRFRAFLFNSLYTSFEAVIQLYRGGLTPSVIRVYDERDTMVHFSSMIDIPEHSCCLILAFDGAKKQVRAAEKTAKSICLAAGGTDAGKKLGKHWWDTRTNMYFPSYLNSGKNVIADTIDVATTYDKLEPLYTEMRAAIEKHPGVHALAHFSHFYPTGGAMYMMFFSQRKNHKDAVKTYRAVLNDAIRACLKVGGTISHQHGVGLWRSQWMQKELGGGYKVLGLIKQALDPNKIMNPGKLGL